MRSRRLTSWQIARLAGSATDPPRALVTIYGVESGGGEIRYLSETHRLVNPPDVREPNDALLVACALRASPRAWYVADFPQVKHHLRWSPLAPTIPLTAEASAAPAYAEPAKPGASIPPGTPPYHTYTVWEIAAFIGLTAFGWFLVFHHLGPIPLLLVLAATWIRDWVGVITLRGMLEWRSLTFWDRFWLMLLFVPIVLMLPLYLIRAAADTLQDWQAAHRTTPERRAFEVRQEIAKVEVELGLLPLTEGACRKCNAALQVGATYCQACGADQADRPRICPRCAVTTLPDAHWCPACGVEFDLAEA